MTVTFGSVCSGIEAASVAWEPLGWSAAWFAEIEPFPSAVLAHHWPDTPNHGDMTRLPALVSIGAIPAPDVLVGGTPCQAFSIAGLRGSLDDDRGALALKFVELANAIDRKRTEPCVIVWENVPGVLNTKDNAFGCFLAGLAGEDEPLVAPGGRWTNAGHVSGPQRTIAWRVLDAQYFGVAQRRRRVFVVASARDGFDPCEILFEREGVRRDTAQKRTTPVSVCLTARGAGSLDDRETYVVEGTGRVRHLTPTECERLQGFPDGHTLVPYRNKPAADGPRYKAIGNSMAVPVMRWIGERIDAHINPMIPVVTMTHAQQALYKICEAAGPDRVSAAYRATMNDPCRDLPFLSTRSVLSFYLSATIGQEARKQCLISD